MIKKLICSIWGHVVGAWLNESRGVMTFQFYKRCTRCGVKLMEQRYDTENR